MGFYPDARNSNFEYFDLDQGVFTKNLGYGKNLINEGVLLDFKILLGINFDELHRIKLNAKKRQEILTVLIQYFELHLTGFKTPKSLEVLKAVFE